MRILKVEPGEAPYVKDMKDGLEAIQQEVSYNKGSNWLTKDSLGFYVRKQDCQPSPHCSVRFEQVEPWSSCYPID